jgi:DNA-binding MurR/RpiR family transcriptional regulator
MSPLIKIRSERDQMSAIERRIADFVLENAQLLRDYSSQQLASALGVSQSSVVKFSQKFGFKGYPDLKYSIGEAVARQCRLQAPDELGHRPDVDGALDADETADRVGRRVDPRDAG